MSIRGPITRPITRRATATVLAATATAAGLVLPAEPASAAVPTVSSTTCQRLHFTAPSGASTYTVYFDGKPVVWDINGGDSVDSSETFPAGTYSWFVTQTGQSTESGEKVVSQGRVTLKGCSATAPKRTAQGDQNGDGRADVLGVNAVGDLYYYRTQSTLTLASGVKAGHGWAGMNWMQQVNDLTGVGTGNYLFARRSDGTLWRYQNHGMGNIYGGVTIGKGFDAYTNLAVLPVNNAYFPGTTILLGSSGDQLYGWEITSTGLGERFDVMTGMSDVKGILPVDLSGDGWADLVLLKTNGDLISMNVTPKIWEYTSTVNGGITTVQVGHGWGSMNYVYIPGDVTGDGRGDIVARRSDTNLYLYANATGGWNPARLIGVHWQGMKLFA